MPEPGKPTPTNDRDTENRLFAEDIVKTLIEKTAKEEKPYLKLTKFVEFALDQMDAILGDYQQPGYTDSAALRLFEEEALRPIRRRTKNKAEQNYLFLVVFEKVFAQVSLVVVQQYEQLPNK